MIIRKFINFFDLFKRPIKQRSRSKLKPKLSIFWVFFYRVSNLLLIYPKKLLRSTLNLNQALRKFAFIKQKTPRRRTKKSPLNPPTLGDLNFGSPQNWGARGAKDRSRRKFIQLRRLYPQRLRTAGFVLPTVMMVLLVFSLVVSSILLRTSQYTEQMINSREAQATNNVATPAIDRAKAKIEFLFKKDHRIPLGSGSTLPNGDTLEKLMLNNQSSTQPEPYKEDRNGDGTYETYVPIYTLPDETRIDVNGDGTVDNGWAYDTDIDGDGTSETVAYSIMMRNEIGTKDANGQKTMQVEFNSPESQKAKKLVARTGPMSIQNSTSQVNCVIPGLKTPTDIDGWLPINTASVRKNFQINAVVVNRNDASKAIASLESQQDRQLDLGNKWGVWFRYDLEAYPGPGFNWNGAMHTDGNIIWGDTGGGTGITAYLISSPQSCLYTEDASEITMSQNEDRKGRVTFQGQVINGNPTPDNFLGASEVDIYPGAGLAPDNGPPEDTSKIVLNVNTDSIKDNLEPSSGVSPYTYSLDPIPLFTEDKSQSRYSSDLTNKNTRSDSWSSSDLAKRMLNKLITRPYVDDTYRADDRWGPKPLYTAEMKMPNGRHGQDINKYVDALTREDPPKSLPEDVGLDGYWERRARHEGLRIIVGQRLELGNTHGWQGSYKPNPGDDDPLYPPRLNASFPSLTNLARQRRTLRDNPAAVQATLIYHQDQDKDFPIATLASTAHPGTITTKANSTTFNNLTNNKVNTDFFNGLGTNGWEFNPPGNVTTKEAFAALIDQQTDPLRIALNNLAHFAGEINGAFPPRQENSASVIVHPHPLLTMWGNFSELRRALDKMDDGVLYSNLSIADRTTIQTAATTLGMLAYNLQNIETFAARTGSGDNTLDKLGGHLWELVDHAGIDSGSEVNRLISSPVSKPSNYVRHNDGNSTTPDAETFYSQFTVEQYLEALNNKSGLGSQKAELIERAKTLTLLGQIERDRLLGFRPGNIPKLSSSTSTWNQSTGKFTITESTNNVIFRVSCDPNIFAGVTTNTGTSAINKQIGLALIFCPADMQPKYPSLFYLFPKYTHNQVGKKMSPYTGNEYLQPYTGAGVNVTVGGVPVEYTEEYTNASSYIYRASDNTGINRNFAYKVVKDNNNNGQDDFNPVTNPSSTEKSFDAIAIQPRAVSDWKLPNTTNNTNTGNVISNNGTSRYLAFLDKAFYDGRQLMQVRAMDIDLNLLRTLKVRPTANDSDWWLPKSSIVYAFREDAVREDAIARPAASTWADCNSATELLSAACRMDTNPGDPEDPPINNRTRISTKPVDFYADPARRPFGFRLKNGADISRANTKAGLSFISDNPIYLQGNFNLHQDNSGNRLEEFTQVLNENWTNFYTRGTSGQGTLNSKFAQPEYDRWRPFEILSDAITVLSNNFCDGVAEDGFRNTNSSITEGSTTTNSCGSDTAISSYRNSTLASSGANTWLRENNKEPTDKMDTPIRVDRNGQLYTTTNKTTAFNSYRSLDNGKTLNDASETRMNVLMIGGLVPSRPFQSYGGLHNFPRYIENWGGDNLHISGAFIQLNFSAYGTAPWDHEAWEPGENPVTGERLGYYSPPNRRWGYDVALQYSSPGPIAARFVSVGSPRNEFYQQIPANDPYVQQLRCSWVGGRRIDPNANCL